VRDRVACTHCGIHQDAADPTFEGDREGLVGWCFRCGQNVTFLRIPPNRADRTRQPLPPREDSAA
jgi:hypothetical protein